MHDGTCLITFVAGVSFLLLMELNRLGAFSSVGQALNEEFAPRQAVAAQVHPGSMQAGKKPVASVSVSTAAPAGPSSDIDTSGTDTVSNEGGVVHVADGRVGPHRTRTRDRATDRT